jgi:anthranilate phosphoribosyltransferase
MFVTLLNKLIARADLTLDEAAALLDSLLSPEVTDAQVGAALIALAAKEETAEELAGFAATMRERAARVTTSHTSFIDTCGTGGSTAKTFNVSTAVAFVVAAAGLPVAKHGNVGVTSKAGSADVLRALGVKVELTPAQVARSLDEIGIGFMFAPLHHAATKRVAMIRRELGVRTIFNLLGPLTNPAGAPFQIAGVSHPTASEKVAQAMARLGTRRAWVVRGTDGLDEITLGGETVVYEAGPDGVRRFEIAPEDFGLRRSDLQALRGGSAEENAMLIRAVLGGERRDAARDLIAMNAAAALFVAGTHETLSGALDIAAQAIDSGAAAAKIDALCRFSQEACA